MIVVLVINQIARPVVDVAFIMVVVVTVAQLCLMTEMTIVAVA